MYKSSYLEQVSRKSEQYHAKYGTNPFRANTAFFLWNLCRLLKFNLPMRPRKDNVCRIGFLLKGGVGDILIALNYLQNLHRFLDGAFAFDIYVSKKRGFHEIVQVICREQDFVKRVLPKSQKRHDYDLFVELVRYPDIIYFNQPKIQVLSPQLYDWCMAVDQFHQEYPVVYRYATHGDYLGVQLAALQGRNRLQQADVGSHIHVESVFRPKILVDTSDTLSKFSLNGQRFITMQRGVGGGDRNISTRLWPTGHYEALTALIKNHLPDVSIVQVGTKKSLPIHGVDQNLLDKTSFEEIMVLMRESHCHIDGECGLVHLRHFLAGGKSIVLFGPTNENFLGYEENVNIRSDVCPGGCEWMTATYTSKCVRGFAENPCLTMLSPEQVLIKVLEILNASSANPLDLMTASIGST